MAKKWEKPKPKRDNPKFKNWDKNKMHGKGILTWKDGKHYNNTVTRIMCALTTLQKKCISGFPFSVLFRGLAGSDVGRRFGFAVR